MRSPFLPEIRAQSSGLVVFGTSSFPLIPSTPDEVVEARSLAVAVAFGGLLVERVERQLDLGAGVLGQRADRSNGGLEVIGHESHPRFWERAGQRYWPVFSTVWIERPGSVPSLVLMRVRM